MQLDPHVCYQALLARDTRYDGKFFVCVRTTRIYCRPICPTHPPKFANCFFVQTAAAAHEAGCRPCIRCRPESSPDTAAWAGTSAVVTRAMRLIEDGALDGGGVPELARRLGLGERHLRRLFAQHIGASPIAVAQTRRILLAKQLIHETTLSMVDIALASGFGSVRRFNETFQKLFQRAPLALRKSSAAASGAASGISLLLSYRPPYDWDTVLRHLSHRMIPTVEQIANRRYARAFSVDGVSGTICVRHRPEKCALQADVDISDLSRLSDILERIRRLFDLRSDPITIDAALMRDTNLIPLVRQRPGIRVPGVWDDREIFLWTLMESRIGRTAAATTMSAIGAMFGRPASVVGFDAITRAFPELIRADLSLADSSGVVGLDKSWVDEVLRVLRHDERIFQMRAALVEALTRLLPRGADITWATEYLAMRVLRDVEALPLEAGPRNSRSKNGAAVTRREMPSDECRPWLAYAAMHVWARTVPSVK